METESERTLNGQTTDFFPVDDIWPNRENSFEIIEMLDREYDLVMIFEKLDESLVLMAHALCIPLSYVTVFQLNNMKTAEEVGVKMISFLVKSRITFLGQFRDPKYKKNHLGVRSYAVEKCAEKACAKLVRDAHTSRKLRKGITRSHMYQNERELPWL